MPSESFPPTTQSIKPPVHFLLLLLLPMPEVLSSMVPLLKLSWTLLAPAGLGAPACLCFCDSDALVMHSA